MSSDQSTHHSRRYWFFLDRLSILDEETKAELADIKATDVHQG
jgi:hypothetical protein